MIINIITILVVVGIVIRIFGKDYYRGLFFSVFLLVLLPKNMCIELGSVLPVITVHRIIVLIMFIMWINNKTIEKHLSAIPFYHVFVLLILSMAISAVLSPDIIVSTKRYLYFVYESFLFFIILQTSLRDERDINALINYVIVSLVFVALIGHYERLSGFNPTHIFGQRGGVTSRFGEVFLFSTDIRSTFPHRILLGVAMGTGMMYMMYMINVSHSLAHKVMNWFLLFIIGTILYYSLSRGPWYAAGLGASVLLFCSIKTYWKSILLITGIAIIVFTLKPGTKDTMYQLINSTNDPNSLKSSSYQWRFIIFETAKREINNSKSLTRYLFGYGQSTHDWMDFGVAKTSTGYYNEIQSWDCEYAIVLYELGALGAIIYLVFFASIYIRTFIFGFKNPYYRSVIAVLLSNFVIIGFMKSNVAMFSENLTYIEFINVSMASYYLSGKA